MVHAQNTTLVSHLVQDLSESSGLIYLDNHIISHNDSGGEAALYEVDTLDGDYTRKVIVGGASNIDWEDCTHDDTYIYIGDFGNNTGTRVDLKIYRLLISDYIAAINDTVQSEVIHFSYSDQVDFSPSQFSTNFDAEAMMVFNDTIYVFSKNWGNQMTNIYAIPNSIGSHTAIKIDSLDPQGLITGATYDSITKSLLLIGYQTSPFVYAATHVIPPCFSANDFFKTNIIVQNSIQIEGVTSIGKNYYFSAEQNPLGAASLYRFRGVNHLAYNEYDFVKVSVYPNPILNDIIIETDMKGFKVLVYDSRGSLIVDSNQPLIDCSNLSPGFYIIQVLLTKAKTSPIVFNQKFYKPN